MDIGVINKAIVSVIGGIATIATMVLGADVSFLTPELIAAVGSIITSILVYAIPNKEPSE